MSIGVAFLVSCCVSHVRAWPAAANHVPTAEQSPSIEVSLGPPLHPLLQISDGIAGLDQSREAFESAMMSKVRQAGQQALVSARKDISAVMRRFLRSFSDAAEQSPSVLMSDKRLGHRASFFAKQTSANSGDTSFVVHVRRGHSPDASVQQHIKAFEQSRSDSETDIFQKAIAEIADLGDRVGVELEALLDSESRSLKESTKNNARSRVGFLEVSTSLEGAAVPPVTVTDSDSKYPTIETLVQDMAQRRLDAETLVQWQIEQVKLDLMQAANIAIEEALEHAMKEIVGTQ